MLEFYDRHGVEKGVLLPLGNAENTMQSQSNEEVLNIAKLHPGRFIPFCNVDPRNLCNNAFTSRYLDTLKWYRDKGYVSPLDRTLKELLRTGRITPAVYRKVARENQLRELGMSSDVTI